MSVYLICLTSNGGLPILTRKKGNCDNLPFSTIASLNGLHMFFKSLGVELYTTYGGNWTYMWRNFYNLITVIVCTCSISKYSTELLPDIVFGAFSLFVSGEEMTQTTLLERLKKEAKNYLPIIDAALESCMNQLLGFSSCLLSTVNAQMLQCLNEEFCTQCGSLFCCVVIGHKIAVATEGWWDLDIIDRQLLMFLQSSIFQNDIAVYLPKKSPNVAYRFIKIPISSNSVLCVICGAEPSLQSLHDITENTIRCESSLLSIMERSIPRALPDGVELDPTIVAIIIANSLTRKYVFSSNVNHNTSVTKYSRDFRNLDILRKFFDYSISNAWHLFNQSSNYVFEMSYQCWSLDSHKCLSQINGNNIICLLFISSMPMHTMKYVGRKVFEQTICDKIFCW